MEQTRIFRMSFASIYQMYIQKAVRKGRSREEVNTVICWLTGYDLPTLQTQIANECSLETFFAQAPCMHPNVSKITGTICGYRIEDMEEGLMKHIRYMDKLVDELAKGKALQKVLRE